MVVSFDRVVSTASSFPRDYLKERISTFIAKLFMVAQETRYLTVGND